MKFFVLDEQSERCEGLKALLRQIDRHASFTEARNWHHAEAALRRGQPDLLLVDWHAHSMSVADVQRVLQHYPTLSIAVLSDLPSPLAISSLLQAGVLGVVPRDLDPRLIVRALEIVSMGGHYVPARALGLGPTAPAIVLRGNAPAERQSRPAPSGCVAPLSPRQHQILRLVHMGSTNKVIARALDISEGTVKIHLASVFRLLGANNRAAAVAIYNGWHYSSLEVLAPPGTEAARPTLGMRGPIPLRSGGAAGWRPGEADAGEALLDTSGISGALAAANDANTSAAAEAAVAEAAVAEAAEAAAPANRLDSGDTDLETAWPPHKQDISATPGIPQFPCVGRQIELPASERLPIPSAFVLPFERRLAAQPLGRYQIEPSAGSTPLHSTERVPDPSVARPSDGAPMPPPAGHDDAG